MDKENRQIEFPLELEGAGGFPAVVQRQAV
jgi:hypothetical protein